MKNKISKLILILNTVKYLRWTQLFYQVYYRLKKNEFLVNRILYLNLNKEIKFRCHPVVMHKYLGKKKFRLLNIEHQFNSIINWDCMSYGKLWNYNLEYFDFLQQDEISVEERKALIYSFYDYSIKKRRTLEPYPVSLRAINIIKFTIKYNLDEVFLNYVFQELKYLNRNYEYHLLSNHYF